MRLRVREEAEPARRLPDLLVAHDEPQLAEELARRADTFGRHLDLDRFARSWNEDVHAQRARPRVVGTVVRRRVGANLVLLPIR